MDSCYIIKIAMQSWPSSLQTEMTVNFCLAQWFRLIVSYLVFHIPPYRTDSIGISHCW